MKLPNYKIAGYDTTYRSNGGEITVGDHNQTYPTPYQIKFKGLLLTKKVSTDYDSDAFASYPVVVPANAGEVVTGWADIKSSRTDQLPGAPETFHPYGADQTDTRGTYIQEESEFFAQTVAPLRIGQKVGFPAAANTTFAVNTELTVSNGGFVKPATAGEMVYAIAEWQVDNTGKAAGAQFVPATVIGKYVKV